MVIIKPNRNKSMMMITKKKKNTKKMNFADPEFAYDGLRNYYRFLQLKKNAPTSQTIVPTYQIDLFWHTHILSSVQGYFDDCTSIIGHTMNHDDSLNDRTEGGTLDVAFRSTVALWKEKYGEKYHIPGGMYRGEPPSVYYTKAWPSGQDVVDDAVPLGPYLHMINVHGASSTSPQAEWTPVNGKTPDGKPGFIKAALRAPVPEVNNNKEKKDYIFGKTKGVRMLGYYHVTTKEAYMILCERIDMRLKHCQMGITNLRATIGCCGMTSKRAEDLAEKEKRFAQLTEIRNVAYARSQAEFRVGKLGLPEPSKKTIADGYFYSSDGTWLVPRGLFVAGGGCGAAPGMCGGAAGCGLPGVGRYGNVGPELMSFGYGGGGGGCGGGGGGC